MKKLSGQVSFTKWITYRRMDGPAVLMQSCSNVFALRIFLTSAKGAANFSRGGVANPMVYLN